MSAVARFLGDSPLRVVLKLIVVSFLVGIVMSAFGWSPVDILNGIHRFFLEIWNMGFAAIDRFVGYFLPHEGTNDVGYGVISFDSLADYEAYRARLREDPKGRANFASAERHRLILREERSFLRDVEVAPS